MKKIPEKYECGKYEEIWGKYGGIGGKYEEISGKYGGSSVGDGQPLAGRLPELLRWPEFLKIATNIHLKRINKYLLFNWSINFTS